uniref:Arachidonate 15-lipoxygenase B n=1 Tax=Fundulus heteroclitus TaxID=8078 RepID=A0A3Q2QGI5_FUNHE
MELNLNYGLLPVERVLGVQWCVQSDAFKFKISIQDRPLTRRGILSVVSSIYDPLGELVPVVLKAKLILQELCRKGLGWDHVVPLPIAQEWINWIQELHLLESFKVDRCLKPVDFGNVASAQLHHFADASEVGYGTATYLRLCNTNGKLCCTLIMRKSRVVPLKPITIPRLKLTAAVVAARMDRLWRKELQMPLLDSVFWTDSTSVLKYIKNETSRFRTFVANRVTEILNVSCEAQWRHVSTSSNPADLASRGLGVKAFLMTEQWTCGPRFLLCSEKHWPTNPDDSIELLEQDDHEVKIIRPCFPDYVHDHWKEDSFFGYQFLNGVNPMVIRRCPALPQNFPVTDEMVFKGSKQRLKYEMKKGNIFLCDYKILDGVKANIINGKQQYLVAPLVLLHKTPDDKLMPIAIQLKQTPAEDNPIFLPTDSEWDWLLAKTFVRNADLNLHQLSFHLLRTHLLAEVFTVALLRHLPMMHPLYKLLMPHTRYTLMINFLARKLLISDTGMLTILREALSSVTYRSLCLPDDISDRGLEDVPNFYYRDDGLKLWNIIYRFVKGTLSFYYKDDKMVQDDQALQEWIYAIYSNGFTNIPMRLNTVKELLKFVTMVIFTCSAQHSAVNSGQYDFIGWMPNTPVSLEGPPPSRKGEATEATMLDTLPSIDVTVHGMATVWLLSKQSSDSEYLGNYPEQRFTDKVPLEKIKTFKQQLKKLHKQIKKRNKHLKPPYTYLDPKVVENSVSL